MDIEKMKSVELDIKVATDVMKWHEWKNFEDGDYRGEYPMFYFDDSGFGIYVYEDVNGPDRHFAPSTDIAAAWQVVEKMAELGKGITVWSVIPSSDPDVYIVHFGDARKKVTEFTATEAICRAALKAVEAEK